MKTKITGFIRGCVLLAFVSSCKKMKTKLITLIFICASVSVSAQQYDTLYNSTIITLSKIGLPPATIISKIQTSYTSFDVSTNALINLSQNGVNGDVINEMIKKVDKSNTSAVKKIDINNPNAMQKPGIYLYNPDNKEKPLKKVDPTVASSQSSGGGSFYGIGGGSTTSYLSGAQSKFQINQPSPVFYFYFENNANPNADSWFFATATSPNEFVLVKLYAYERKKYRNIQIGTTTIIGGSYSEKSGVREKDKVPFEYMEISEGIYKITFREPLKPGEYCFMYSSATPAMYTNDKVWDFGTQNGQ